MLGRLGRGLSRKCIRSISTIPPVTQLTEDELMLQESVKAFAKDTVQPLVKTMDETCEFPRHLHDSMFEQGVCIL